MSSPLQCCLYIVNRPKTDDAKIGGGGRSLLSLWQGLGKSSWKSHAVCPKEGFMGPAAQEAGIPFTYYSYEQPSLTNPLATLNNYLTWRRILRSVRPKLIHSNAPDAARSVALTAASLGVKHVCHVRFPIGEEGISWVFRGLPKPNAFIFNSYSLRDETWPHLKKSCPRSQAFVVHNAVDLEAFKPAPWPGGDRFRIGMVANLMPAKAHEDFILMAEQLIRDNLDAEFWIVGEDVHQLGRKQKLMQLAADLGIQTRVRFLGHRADIPEVLTQLHLTVLTSHVETFGRVLIESMACGRPVVAARVGGIPEVITHGETGHMVEAGDYAAMAQIVKSLLADRRMWQRMSDNGIRLVQERFSIERHTKAMVSVYEELLS